MSIAAPNPLLLETAAESGGDVVTRSLRFNGDASLQRTPSSSGDNNTWTVAFWIKRGELGSRQNILHAYDGSSSNRMNLRISANDVLVFYSGGSVGEFCAWDGTRKLRDVGAFYHICVVMDATQSTATDRMKVWINGEPETLNSKSGYNWYPAQNASSLNWNNGAYEHEIGDQGGIFYIKLYLADFYHLDGTAVSTPVGNFIELGDYKNYVPKAFDMSSHGGNSFHLKFEDSSDIGADSANSNDFTATNLGSHDVVLDRPSNNYATINPLIPYGSGTSSHTVTLSEGNLRVDYGSGSGRGSQDATIAVSSGKFYFEALVLSSSQSTGCQVGVHPVDGWVYAGDSTKYLGFTNTSAAYESEGDLYTNDSNTSTGFDTYTTGDVIGCAFDVDSRKIWFSKNGTWQNSGDPANGSNPAVTLSGSGSLVAAVRAYYHNLVVNFGADPYFAGNKTSGQDTSQNEFYYAPPTGGFKSLNTSNLDDPTIKPHEVFGVATYSGTGSATTVSTEFQPNLVWVKRRNSSANHVLTDSVRGANKALNSNTTSTEDSSTSLITAFNSTSFGVGTDSKVNASGGTYAGWHFKESANAGFDIVTWSGNSGDTYGSSSVQNVSHSLGVAPEMIIAKARTDDSGSGAGAYGNWCVYHKDLSSDYYLNLNSTSSEAQHEGYLFSSIGASTVGFGNDLSYSYEALNMDYSEYYGSDPDTYVAYLFSSVEGVSKVGSYTGNGSSDGPFIYTGFRPAFVMVRAIDNSYSWYIHDTARSPHNYSDLELTANSSGAEYSVSGASAGERLDFLSNGFKHRTSNAAMNQSGYKYAYLAFAHSPLKYANSF